MSARVTVFVVLVSHALVTTCVTVNNIHMPDDIDKTKTELPPLLVSASLYDIVIISAPIVNSHTSYYLNKPNGDVYELNLNISHVKQDCNVSENYKDNNMHMKHIKGEIKEVITPINKYKIYNLIYERNCRDTEDVFERKEKELMSNDFMVGPLDESYHGNWVLSAFYEGNGCELIELFQVITIEIIEVVPTLPARPSIRSGEDLYLRFAYPLQHLESCEIIAPRSTFDRFYNRDKMHFDSCGFHVPNVTRDDEGVWKIVGVGKIVYEADIYLEIKSNVT